MNLCVHKALQEWLEMKAYIHPDHAHVCQHARACYIYIYTYVLLYKDM